MRGWKGREGTNSIVGPVVRRERIGNSGTGRKCLLPVKNGELLGFRHPKGITSVQHLDGGVNRDCPIRKRYARELLFNSEMISCPSAQFLSLCYFLPLSLFFTIPFSPFSLL